MTAVIERSETPDASSEHNASQQPASPARRSRRRRTPPGHEKMAPPWRMSTIGIGLALGLVVRLFIANGVGALQGDGLVMAATASSALVAIGLLMIAAQRDRFGAGLWLLAVLSAASLGVVQWVSPHFADGTLEWSRSSQTVLVALGLANGLLISGIMALALARRRPTLSTSALLIAGVVVLLVDTLLLRNEWPAVIGIAVASGATLVAWDRAPRHEPIFEPGDVSPRISRAMLGLATLAFCGAAIQLWISRGDNVGQPLPAIIAACVFVLIAFAMLIGIRREIQNRKGTLSEWASWMREIRTHDLQSEFDSLSTSDSGAVVGDVTGSTHRSLSFPDLRAAPGLRSLELDDRDPSPLSPDQLRQQPSSFERAWAQDRPVATPSTPTLSPVGETARQDQLGPRPAFEASDLDGDAPDRDRSAPGLPATTLRRQGPAPASRVRSTGAFSGALAATRPAPKPWTGPAPAADLGDWLTASNQSPARLVIAVETMSLASFDALDEATRANMVMASARSLASLAQNPDLVAHIDGPYLLAAWDNIVPNQYGDLNRAIMAILAEPPAQAPPPGSATGTHGLTGTLALLRPSPTADLASLVDDAIAGLIRARELAVVPRRS